MMLWYDEKLELDKCTESGVATRSDPTTAPPSLSLSLSLGLSLSLSLSLWL